AQGELARSYGLPQDALDRLPPMEMQLALKLSPVMARAIPGNSFNIGQLMATTYHALLVAESSVMAVAGFAAGRACAAEAQRLRDLRAAGPAQHRAPDLVWGPACVQVFPQIALAVRDAGDQVGLRNKDGWAAIYGRLEPMDIEALTMMIRGCRVSQCLKENQARITVAISEHAIEVCFLKCAEQLGAEIKPGPAPRGHQERLFQLAMGQLCMLTTCVSQLQSVELTKAMLQMRLRDKQ
ncbi:unnamed protein product, partial [Prorocentrum cordatum]